MPVSISGEFNMGYNGSENFIQGHRMGFFPAVSLSYVLSEENFLKNTSWLDLLKFRFSYGLVGNDDNGSRFCIKVSGLQVGRLIHLVIQVMD